MNTVLPLHVEGAQFTLVRCVEWVRQFVPPVEALNACTKPALSIAIISECPLG